MQRIRDVASRFTPLSLALSSVLLIGYIVTLAIPSTKKYVVLIPGKAYYAIWTCTTSSFAVLNPLELVVDLSVVLFSGRFVEPCLGGFEMIKYLLFVSAASGGGAFLTAYLTYVLSGRVGSLWVAIYGSYGLIGAMLVALKQASPDHVLRFFDIVPIRAEWLASIYVLVGIPVGLLYKPLAFYPFLFYGTYSAWFYLRFIQVDPRTQLRGDPSPSFNFASFFPEIARPAANKFASMCSRTSGIRIREHTPIHSHSESAPQYSYDQTRRRQGDSREGLNSGLYRERGQKALEERLGSLPTQPANSEEATNKV